MKRISLAIMMLLTFFVSCGKKEVSQEGTPTLKIVTIGNRQPGNYDTWVKKVNEYIEPKIGANIDLEVISWGDWQSRRSVITASNEAFDILFADTSTYQQDVSTGVFLDLTEMLTKPEYKDLYSFIPKDYWEGVKINGKIYSVPTYKDSSMTRYFIVDKALTDKYNFNIENAKELKDFDNFFRQIKNDTKKAPFILNDGGIYSIFTHYDSFGLPNNVLAVKIDDPSAKVISAFEDPYVVENLELIHKWYKEGIINPDAATNKENPKYRPFFIEQGWPSAAKTVWGPNMGVEVVLSQFGKTVLSNNTLQGSLNGISASSLHPDKALLFLQLINTDTKLRDMFAYGEEGVNFEYVDAFGEKRVDNDSTKYSEWGVPAYAQATFFNMTITKDVEFNQWNEVRELNNNATPSVLLGFSFDSSSVMDEIANVNAVYKKYYAELLTGTKEPKELTAQMISEMKAVGLDKIQEEAQKQIDEWKKNK